MQNKERKPFKYDHKLEGLNATTVKLFLKCMTAFEEAFMGKQAAHIKDKVNEFLRCVKSYRFELGCPMDPPQWTEQVVAALKKELEEELITRVVYKKRADKEEIWTTSLTLTAIKCGCGVITNW